MTLVQRRGHRTLRILGKGNKPALIPPVLRAARTIDLAVVNATKVPSSAATTASASTAAPLIDGRDPSASEPGWAPCTHLRAGFIMAALEAGVPLRDVQIAARHADPRTTTIYDRRRENSDRHAAYVLVAFVAGG
jgi:hypothetical protein